MTSLVAGRVVRAAVPGATEAALRALPAVSEVEVRGAQAVDLLARLRRHAARAAPTFPQARDIEVTAVGLEGAFLSLTSECSDTTGIRRSKASR